MTTDFRGRLVDRIRVNDIDYPARAQEALEILNIYDRHMAESPRTDDPDDEEGYDAAMAEYLKDAKSVLVDELVLYDGHFDDSWLNAAVDAIAALPKPVKGGERRQQEQDRRA